MAAEPTNTKSQEVIALTPQVLKEILAEVKRPYIDEEAIARKERDRLRLRREQKRAVDYKKKIAEACGHIREDNTSAIAWMQNSDLVTRGVCQRCNSLFQPGNKDYIRLIKIPVGRQGVVYG